MSLRVVFDTNVLFSAVGWHGNPARCVEMVQTGRIQGIVCPEILDELVEKLALKLDFTDEQIGVVLASLLSMFEVTAISGTMTHLQADPNDDMILECAVVANANAVVTGDRRHLLPLKVFRGIRLVNPAELLALVESSEGRSGPTST